jgi:hypothetical protein
MYKRQTVVFSTFYEIVRFMPIVFFFAAALAGCGYSIHRKADLPFTAVKIGLIDNRTLEPKLQDRLNRALVEEFARNGISVTQSAKNSLSGVVSRFEMVSLAEKDDITVVYSVIVEADFKYVDDAGGIREIKRIGSPFIVSFTASRDMATLLGSRTIAEERAASDIAREIVGALIYK